MISPAQCRAARALLGWSQEDLETRSGVAKKTIADFERDARFQREGTTASIESAFVASGIAFIPQNGGGEGVRLSDARPRLFRRKHVFHRGWVAFAFDYKGRRYTGFVDTPALVEIALINLSPAEVFDRDRVHILDVAAEKVDRGDLDEDGRVRIVRGDL